MTPRIAFFCSSIALFALVGGLGMFWPGVLWALVVVVPLFLIGIHDMTQTSHSILRNFPVIGHGRYLMEMIRPEINQYFVESNTDGKPFSREQRSVVYQRSKNTLDTLPFGTQMDVYEPGYEFMEYSLQAMTPSGDEPRVTIGGSQCKQPYSASILNISAMSYGALSDHAVMALNRGAKLGNFAHNTGEGGISPHHLQGGDLIWQIGTGYFGCRTDDGTFSPDKFREQAHRDVVRMIEIKLTQGAKPGHGGILPAAKVSEEIAAIRGVPQGRDVISPPSHSAFSNPRELLQFVTRLRELSGGKPVGWKLCLGSRREFLAICKAMIHTDITPDFITVDGAEGGTGAAPLEFSNRVGVPLFEGLSFVHNALVGCGLRDRIHILASGRVTSGFHMARLFAVGADVCYSARGMLFALGCIQALRCDMNSCPTGITTHRRHLVRGLVVADKDIRVRNFHSNTIEACRELLGAAGLHHPKDMRPEHLHRRIDRTRMANYAELYPSIAVGALLDDEPPASYATDWRLASPDTF